MGVMFVKKTFNLKLLKYELRNLTGNIFALIFGVLFPIFFTIFFDKTINIKLPDEIRPTVSTTMFITSSMIVPLATTFIGYAAIFSQELEKEIPLRLRLFGYSDKI
jgi:ABC-2 type transport system permease protein